ncbi:MAG: HAD family hydrolase [Albidovulum sp.]
MPSLEAIALDADDTLWHNERFFRLTQDHFAALLADVAPREHLEARLLAAEQRNLGTYGFGIKGFMLSMIETALEVTEDKVPARVIREIVAAGQEMLAHPIELLPNARAAVERLARSHPLLLITKGDLLDQERKLAQSGLGDFFAGVEIVSDKTPPVYAAIFARRGLAPGSVLMAGNSLKSDVLPVLEVGGFGVHVPHDLTWALERVAAPEDHARFHRIDDLGDLPTLVERIEMTS